MPADTLVQLLRAYATLKHPKSILKPDVSFTIAHDFVLHHILLNLHFQRYPPSPEYQLIFWKWTIEWLESMAAIEDEVDERIYTHQVQLMQDMSSRNIGLEPPTTSHFTYLWPSDSNVHGDNSVLSGFANATLLESRTTIESGTTGMRTWSASLILAEYLLDNPGIVTGKRVLELGCGVGFLGTIIASIQHSDILRKSSSLWLTDVREAVLQRYHSHQHSDIHFKSLDWSDVDDPTRRSSLTALFKAICPNIILGADLVYDPSVITVLVNVLHLTFQAIEGLQTPLGYIALTVRNEETISTFLRQAEQTFVVEEVFSQLASCNVFTGNAELGQDASTQMVKIFRLTLDTL